MDKNTFDMILGPLEQLNKRGKEQTCRARDDEGC